MNHADIPTGKFERSVSMVCWAYNEEELILEYLERATTLMDSVSDDYEIVLVDDGSTDETNAIATRFQKINPRLRIYRNEKNLNVGLSGIRAIKLATKEYLFWQTVDWSYDISGLRRNLEYLKEYDIVQGVRRRPVHVKSRIARPIKAVIHLFGIEHITKRSDTIFKAVVSVVNYILIRLMFRTPISDFQNITIYPTKWVQSIKFDSVTSFFNPEALIKSYWSGKSIREVPVSFIPRSKGVAKGTRFNAIVAHIYDLVTLWFKWVALDKSLFRNRGKICRLDSE